MQDCFAGNVGDFGKFGLLRHLTGQRTDGSEPLSLGVIWYLVPNEKGNHDGKETEYLNRHEKYLKCDPDLFKKLKCIVDNNRRTVADIERNVVLSHNTRFFREPLAFEKTLKGDLQGERKKRRKKWFQEAVAKTRDCDIIFVDPDNGIAPSGSQKENRLPKTLELAGPKYISWEEIKELASLKKTLVIYQHQIRIKNQREKTKVEITKQTGRSDVIPVCFHKWGRRFFFVLPAEEHKEAIECRLDQMKSHRWNQQRRPFWSFGDFRTIASRSST